MSGVSVDIKKAFFRPAEIERSIDKAEMRALSRAGFVIMREQRASIKKRKSASAPGAAPHAHTNHPYATPKNILYGYDRLSHSVDVGMVRLQNAKLDGTDPLPGLLEKGGTVRRFVGKNKKRAIRIRKRPSAVPALERSAATGELIEPWAGVVVP